jgi:hypothetical protein
VGGLGEEFKYCLVSWSKVCSSTFEGGLEVRTLLFFNCALWGSGCGAICMREMPCSGF